MNENQQLHQLIAHMAQINNELICALRTAHDHLLFNNQTHTRTFTTVIQALEKYDAAFHHCGDNENLV